MKATAARPPRKGLPRNGPSPVGLSAVIRHGAFLPRAVMRGAIRLYQLTLSAWLGRQCRFGPSCSEYAMEAVERHGALAGGWLAIKRVCRCHPWGGSGYDPVPDSVATSYTSYGAASGAPVGVDHSEQVSTLPNRPSPTSTAR